MRGAIDLLEQSLQIDLPACAGRGDYQFHCHSVIPSGAKRSRGIAQSNQLVILRDQRQPALFVENEHLELAAKPGHGPFDVPFVHEPGASILRVGR